MLPSPPEGDRRRRPATGPPQARMRGRTAPLRPPPRPRSPAGAGRVADDVPAGSPRPATLLARRSGTAPATRAGPVQSGRCWARSGVGKAELLATSMGCEPSGGSNTSAVALRRRGYELLPSRTADGVSALNLLKSKVTSRSQAARCHRTPLAPVGVRIPYAPRACPRALDRLTASLI